MHTTNPNHCFLIVLAQADLTKAKDELAKVKEELAKSKEDALAFKQKSQAHLKASKEEEKAKTKAASQVASLEKDKERLSEELKSKAKELKRLKDQAAELESEKQELKASLDRANARLEANAKLARKAKEQRDLELDDEDAFAVAEPARKRLKLTPQPPASLSLEATIQQQVAEALKRMVPPGFNPPQQQPHSTDIYPPPPPAPARYAYSSRDPWYGSSDYSSSFQTPSTTWSKTAPVPQQQTATPPGMGTSPTSAWATTQLNLSHDIPLETPAFPFGVTTTSRPRSPVAEAKPEAPSQQDLFKAFMEFMNNKNKSM